MKPQYNRDDLSSMRVALRMEVDASHEQATAFERKTGTPSLFYTEQCEALTKCLKVIESLVPTDCVANIK